MTAKYTLFKGRDNQFYWNLKASNGEIIAQSEGYTVKQSALNGIQANRTYAPTAMLDDQTAKTGTW